MTIGIAAYGPNAGLAVLRALAAVETVGRGAIGGFVSFAALASSGEVIRAETQDGGTGGLFPGGLAFAPAALLEAPVAGLMSSGPDRPEPLQQFTPVLSGVGLVTGHRMPNTIGANGVSLNEEVLALMKRGLSPEEAVKRVVAANPQVDAGIIALSADGHIFAADTAHVRRRRDTGEALSGSREASAIVAVLHNAIHPFRPLASLASEVALDTMQPADKPDGWIRFREGARLRQGLANAVDVAGDGLVDTIFVEDARFLAGSWSLGLGYETAVVRSDAAFGVMLYEPYMVVQDGQLRTVDGKPEKLVPIRCASPAPSFSC
jgi:hypothetical protein